MSGIFDSIPATPEEVGVFGASLTDVYLRCRVWGHDPDPQGNTRLSTAKEREGVTGSYWVANPPCTHGCGVRWLIFATADGEVLRRSLDYTEADGYLSESGRIDAKGRAVLRREYFLRTTKRRRTSTRGKA